MKRLKLDLLVIGAGLSGLMAAYTAALSGWRVRVIAAGLGALHWHAGTVDVFGYAPGVESPVRHPLAQARALASTQPDHPYALLAEGELAEAMTRFRRLSEEIGLPYGGGMEDENLLTPSPVGAVRPTFLAPRAQLAGDLRRSDPMLIVGFRGLRDFYPRLIADNLARQGHAARAAFLPLEVITARRDNFPVHLAQALDDPARSKRLGEEVRKLVEPGERVGLPAILGLKAHSTCFAELEQGAGAPIFEIPTLPPSVPGMRLFQALRSHLEGMGVSIEVGMEAIRFSADGRGRILWVETESSARPLRQRAERYLLATGGILGGGFDSDHTGRVWEVVFDLPLTLPQRRSQWLRPRFLDPAGQPVFRGGVLVDRHFQPVTAGGARVFANLWVAGGALAGTDSIAERSLEGVAIATGMAASERMHRRVDE